MHLAPFKSVLPLKCLFLQPFDQSEPILKLWFPKKLRSGIFNLFPCRPHLVVSTIGFIFSMPTGSILAFAFPFFACQITPCKWKYFLFPPETEVIFAGYILAKNVLCTVSWRAFYLVLSHENSLLTDAFSPVGSDRHKKWEVNSSQFTE